MTSHRTMSELEASLPELRSCPADEGEILLLVRRPDVGEREVVEEATFDVTLGLVGDNWRARGSNKTPDGAAHPDMQLNIMSSRVADLVAMDRSRWALAGDQIYVDMDLSQRNLPAGTVLSLGTARIEVTPMPHNGCKKFVERFGLDAMKFVNSAVGKELHLRGINAKVVHGGSCRVGDRLRIVSRRALESSD